MWGSIVLCKKPFSLGLITISIMILVGCASSGKDSIRDTTSPQKPQAPSRQRSFSPGTAKVSAVVLTHTERERQFVCSCRIKTVHGYGSGTPPLPSGTEITVKVRKSLIKKIKRKPAQLLKKGNTLIMTLRYEQPGIGQDAQASWRVVRFHKK